MPTDVINSIVEKLSKENRRLKRELKKEKYKFAEAKKQVTRLYEISRHYSYDVAYWRVIEIFNELEKTKKNA